MGSLKNIPLLILLVSSFFWEEAAGQVVVSPSLDCLSCDGSATATTANPGNIVYQWYDEDQNLLFSEISGSGSSTLNGLCPGVYSVNIESELFYFSVGTSSSPVAAPAEGTVCNTSGNHNLFNDFGTPPPSGGTWTTPSGNNTPAIINAMNAVDGFYTYTYTSGGCILQTGVLLDVIQNANPGLSTTYLICENYSEFFLLDFMAGSPDPGGQWFDNTAQPMDGYYDPATMNPGTFTYMLNIIPGCGPVFSTISIQENQLPDPGQNATVTACFGSTPFSMIDQLGGNPDPGGTWLNASDVPVPGVFDPLTWSAGTYHYHINGASPCQSQQAYLTVQLTAPYPSGLDNAISLCSNQPAFNMMSQLGGNPLIGGTWYDSAGNATSATFNPSSQPGSSFTYAYSGLGCQAFEAQLDIVVEPLAEAGGGMVSNLCESPNPFNLNDLLTPNSTGGGIWLDETAQPMDSIVSQLPAGTYSFNYFVAGDLCPDDIGVYTLIANPFIQDFADTSISFCETGSVFDLESLVNLDTFQSAWFLNGQPASSVISTDAPGEYAYLLVVSNNSLCPADSSTYAVTVELPSFISQTYSTQVCDTAELFDLESLVSGIDYSLGTWNDGNEIVNPEIAVDPGIHNFQFVSNNSLICPPSTLDINLEVFPQPGAGDAGTVEWCTNAGPLPLSSIVPTGADPGGFWTFNGSPVINAAIDPLNSSQGIYQYNVDGNMACPSDSTGVAVTFNTGPQFTAGNDQQGCSLGESVVLGGAPDSGCSYLWSPSNYLNNTSSPNPVLSFPLVMDEPVEWMYTVTVSNGVCQAQDSTVITVYPLPFISEIADTGVCPGESLELNAGSGDGFLWEPSSLFVDNTLSTQVIQPDSDVELIILRTNEWGCENADTVHVAVYPSPSLEASFMGDNGCPPVMIELINTSENDMPVDYYWQINESLFPGETSSVDLNESGSYQVFLHGESQLGCESVLGIEGTLEVYPVAIASFSYSPSEINTIQNEVHFQSTSIDAQEFQWTMDGTLFSQYENPIYNFMTDVDLIAEVCLEVNNSYGCAASTCKSLEFDAVLQLYVPSAFTPDNDGVNETFGPSIAGVDLEQYNFLIYNRWGQLIFSTSEPHQPWTGNADNGAFYCEPGVYSWIIELRQQDDPQLERYTGHVTLVR